MIDRYEVNKLGDIYEVVHEDGSRAPFDPSQWGWTGSSRLQTELWRSVAHLSVMPGVKVEEEPVSQFLPGPRPASTSWGDFRGGAAPPAGWMARTETSCYLDRLSEAVGYVALRLPEDPTRSPMEIYDWVGGRKFTAQLSSPTVEPGNVTVYLVEDGYGIKIGYTSGTTAERVSQHQTGNSRRITTIAEIFNVPPETEWDLQVACERWHLSGEWYDRGSVFLAAGAAGGFERWLDGLLGSDGGMLIAVHTPYR